MYTHDHHAADATKAVELFSVADARTIGVQAFNCFDCYVSEQEVARLAKELLQHHRRP